MSGHVVESNQVEVQGIDKASEIAGDAYGSGMRRSLTTIQYLNISAKSTLKVLLYARFAINTLVMRVGGGTSVWNNEIISILNILLVKCTVTVFL